MKESERVAREREDVQERQGSELSKLNALIEQKLQLTEKELAELKAKYATKDADLREMSKTLQSTRKQL